MRSTSSNHFYVFYVAPQRDKARHAAWVVAGAGLFRLHFRLGDDGQVLAGRDRVEGVGAFAEHQPEFLLEIGLIRGEELPTPAELTSLDLNEVLGVVREYEIFPLDMIHDSLRDRRLRPRASPHEERKRCGAVRHRKTTRARLVTAG